MGFFRNGKPFRPFGGSATRLTVGSLANRGPASRLPDPPGPWRSVGVENHEDLLCLFPEGGGRDATLVCIGGGGGFDREG